MHRFTDNRLQTWRNPLGVLAKIQPELFGLVAAVAGNLHSSAAADDEVQQFTDLIHVALAADALRRAFVTFEKDSIAPVYDFQPVTVSIPEEVFGVHVVVDNIVSVGGLEQIKQALDDDQHF